MKNNLNRYAAVCMALIMAMGITGCGQQGGTSSQEPSAVTTAETTTTTTATETETTTTTAKPTETTTAATTTTTTTTAKKDDSSEDEDTDVVKLTLDEKIDENKTYVPEEIGTGRAEFVYPWNTSLVVMVYAAPTENSDVVARLIVGTDVTAYATVNNPDAPGMFQDFSYISADGIEGWCLNQELKESNGEGDNERLELKGSELPDNIYDYAQKVYCLADNIEVRSEPSDDADIVHEFGIEDFRTGEKYFNGFWLYGDNGEDWYFVTYDDGGVEKFGWIKCINDGGYDNFYEWDEFAEKYSEIYGETALNKSDLAIVNHKPVIYLYPEKETKVDIKLKLNNAELGTTYPKYNNGWSVTAKPNGKLTDKDGHTYDYLFWDGMDYNFYDTSKGFCVKGEDTVEFFREKLTYLGLNETEMNEFIVYWLPKMENNKYNIISFYTDEYDQNFPITVTPKPDSMLRVMMIYKPSEKYVKIEPQELKSFKRKGFALIEWGGEEH